MRDDLDDAQPEAGAEALASLVASTEPPPIYPYLDAMPIEELTSWEQRVWDWQAKAWR